MEINNDFYEELADDWYDATNHPIALLRAENRVRIPWILASLPSFPITFLDIGCGGGFLTNALAQKGHQVTGLDLSPSSLAIAQKKDPTHSVRYIEGSAYELPFPDHSFEGVAAMDLLEHVPHPERVIQEASRVLKPGGLFFFHTFNRNLLSYLLIIKGVDWLVPNAPKNMHVYPLFIKPQELAHYCQKMGLQMQEWHGFRPRLSPLPFLKMALQKKVPENLTFVFSKSLATGYCGIAKKGDRYESNTL